MKWIINLCLFIGITAHAVANDQFVEHLDWQTFETDNFRVHYTKEYRDWAISAANEMERVRSLIQAQQGRVMQDKVDAVVFDPFNGANGYALPFKNKPFMGLYATPPQSDSLISNSSSWQQLLILHEYVHLVHLSQPERTNWQNQLGKIWDIYDVTSIDTPRWAIEGYATLLESKTSGRGRLFANQVEAVLQQFAREGALPSYYQLSDTEGRYLAGSMAYLVGARFLYWLEQKYGQAMLDNIWPRLRAVKSRTFDDAFYGLYRQSPAQLYRRFIAEYTAQALNDEVVLDGSDPKLWLDLTDDAYAPSLSPDGNWLAIVQRNKTGKVSLRVYATEANEKAQQEFTDEQEKLLADDPLDVADNPPAVFNPKNSYTLNEINYLGISNPRWRDNDTLVFGTKSRDGDGILHADIMQWHITTGQLTRLSREQNLRRFDIHPNGNQAVAERNRFGKSQLVQIDLISNQITPMTEARLERVYDFPRYNPTSPEQLAFVSTDINKSWQLLILDTTDMQTKTVPAPKGYQYLSYPEWSRDGAFLYFVAGKGGKTALYRYVTQDDSIEQVTRANMPVSWPVSAPQDDMYVMTVNSLGPDVYKLATDNPHVTKVEQVTDSAQLDNPFEYAHLLPPAEYNLDTSIGEERQYGAGPQETTMILAASFNSSSLDVTEVGIRGGDLLQRVTWQLNASQSLNRSGLSGIGGSVRWQGWPIKLTAHVFDLAYEPMQFRDPINLPRQHINGGYIEAEYPWIRDTLSVTPFARMTTTGGNTNETTAQLGWTQNWYFNNRSWGIYQRSDFTWLEGDTQARWDGFNASVTLGGQYGAYRLQATARHNRRHGTGPAIRLGGFTSGIFNATAHPNRQFAPELGFDQLNANHIRYYELAAGHEDLPYTFVYGSYQLALNADIEVYGIKSIQRFNREILGASDVNFEYGVMQVNPDNQKEELEAWLGLSYQF